MALTRAWLPLPVGAAGGITAPRVHGGAPWTAVVLPVGGAGLGNLRRGCMRLRPGWWLPLLRVAAGGLITSEGARWCAFGGRWVVVALRVAVLNGVVLHRGCAAVRPGWWLPLLRTAAGGLIESEGVLRCALDCGWAALGNCRRGNQRRGRMGLRPRWRLSLPVSAAGRLIESEGARWCALGGGYSRLRCRGWG